MVEQSLKVAVRLSPFTEVSAHFNTKAGQLQELAEIVEQSHKRIFGETPLGNRKTGPDVEEPQCEWDELTLSGDRLDRDFEYLADSINNLLQRL